MGRTINEYDLFTGGNTKTPDFAIYYNLAVTNIEKLNELLGNNKRKPDNVLDKDLVWAKYLWKANEDARNKTDGYIITEKDKKLIEQFLEKLDHIRNYHSHIWHSNEALAFPPELRKFVVEKYNLAKASVYETNNHAVEEYDYKMKKDRKKREEFFKKFDDKYYITEEGRVFFLSFFLTSGQMSRFLQQRKGSKRNDIPLYKVKHLVYKYYCHRDGASIADFHHEDSILESMTTQQKADVLKARQAYKIISHLNDYPNYLADTERLPLLVPDGNEVRKVETVQDLLQFVNKHGLLPDFTFTEIPRKNKEEEDSREEFTKNRSLAFTLPTISGYTFHIGFDNLYKLVILCMKYGNKKAQLLLDNLAGVIGRREQLYAILSRPTDTWSIDDTNILADRAYRDLRGYRKMTEAGIAFFDDFDHERTKAIGRRAKEIADLLRKEDTQALQYPQENDMAPEPVIVFAHDFIAKEQQKFRTENKFIQCSVQYLIEHNLATGWYWETETFIFNEKKKEFRQDIPDDYRLSIEDGHVTVGIPKTENIISTETARHESFYQFSIGSRALKYLMAFHLANTNRHLAPFLSTKLKADMDNLVKGDHSYQLLEEQFIARYLKTETPVDNTDIVEKLKAKADYTTEQWNKVLEQLPYMKRADKNRAIMECYKFFDWPVDSHGQIKFLRANEYNQMSVCHYSLGVDNKQVKKPKWKYLYEDLFRLNHRKPKVPDEVVNMLNESDSIDTLLRNVISNRQLYLADQIDLLAILPNKKRKELLPELCRKLHVHMPDTLLDEGAIAQLRQKREKTLHVLPFPVHPMLLLKYFEPEAYKQNYAELQCTPQQANNILKRLREPVYTNGLLTEHYDTSFAGSILLNDAGEENTRAKSVKHKWVKAINDTLTEDAILWHIAKTYLSQNPYTATMADVLCTTKATGELHVGNLHGQEMVLELKQVKKGGDKDDTPDSLFTSIRMHQLDDIMFVTEQTRLRRAALHYRRRYTDEKEFWGIQEGTEIYDGTQENPIPYEVLRRELQLVAQHGSYLAGYLMDWERLVLNGVFSNYSPEQKQAELMKISSKNKDTDLDYLSFEKVIEQYEQQGNKLSGIELKTYRGKTLHSGIPVSGSFSWWARHDGEAGKLLGITEPLHTPKDRTKYLQAELED